MMNWDAIGAIGEVVGAIAVVISLVYLALQVRQNTVSNKLLATQNLVNQNSNLVERIGSDATLAALMQKGNIQGASEQVMTRHLAPNWPELGVANLRNSRLLRAIRALISGQLDTICSTQTCSEVP